MNDLSGESTSGRNRFAARAWSLVHLLRFDPSSGRGSLLRDYLEAFGQQGARPQQETMALLGDRPEALAERVHEHLAQDAFRVLTVAESHDPRTIQLRPLSSTRSRSSLGWLALEIENRNLAQSYFERALEADLDHPQALVGLAHTKTGDADEALELLRRADRLAGQDAAIQSRIGDAYRMLAESSSTPEARRRSIDWAREHYTRSHSLDAKDMRARIGLGLLELLAGEDLEAGVTWLESAAREQPGSLGIELGLARLDLARGKATAAGIRAREIISRSHYAPLVEAARTVRVASESRAQLHSRSVSTAAWSPAMPPNTIPGPIWAPPPQ
jgi:tetratricopeptide (TPR) repeat protein